MHLHLLLLHLGQAEEVDEAGEGISPETNSSFGGCLNSFVSGLAVEVVVTIHP